MVKKEILTPYEVRMLTEPGSSPFREHGWQVLPAVSACGGVANFGKTRIGCGSTLHPQNLASLPPDIPRLWYKANGLPAEGEKLIAIPDSDLGCLDPLLRVLDCHAAPGQSHFAVNLFLLTCCNPEVHAWILPQMFAGCLLVC